MSDPHVLNSSTQVPTTPLSERWARTLRDHAQAPAVTTPAGHTTFSQLDALARAEARRSQSTTHRTQGSLLEILTGILAALHRHVPAHLVERDRAQIPLATPPPPETALIKQTVGAAGIRRASFFTASQILADVDRLHHALDLSHRGTGIVAISCAHSYGLTVLPLQLICHGIPLREIQSPFPTHLAEALSATPKAYLPAVPALWRTWINSHLDLTNLTLSLTAGAPLHPSLAHLHNFQDLYGTSETGAISLQNQLLPGVTAETHPTTSHLIIHSDAVAQAFDQPIPGEIHTPGKTHSTTDKVTLQGNSILTLQAQGQAANIAGRKVSPDEVLHLIKKALPKSQHQNLQIQTLKSRDPERHQELAAILTGATQEKLKQLRKTAAPHLAPWQTPRHWLPEPK